jgi:mannitol-1-/sugar-/sorbitol-6-/2-deoxyglucose-6-phosphatase
MAKSKKTTEDVTEQNAPQQAILVEVENVAFRGRQILYEAVKKEFGERSIELSVATFSRCCIESSPQQFVPCLLKSAAKTRFSEERLVSDISDAISKAFRGSIKVEPGFKDLIRIASEKKVLIGGLSSFDKDASVRILDDLGLPGMSSNILSCGDEYGSCPKTNAWLQLARGMSVYPSQCVALASSAASCQAAVAARMRSVVVPDKFTCFQDFGGCDVAFDALDKDAIKAVFDLLRSAAP